MRILRDLRLSTKLLILLELMKSPHAKLKAIGAKLDITPQAISEYLKRMQEEGLIHNMGGELRPTSNGIEFLHRNILELDEFVDATMNSLNLIDVCTAIAGSEIKEGEEVGLFMERGLLKAYVGKASGSTGTALSDAAPGDDVAVRDLEGIVDHSPGRICLIMLPSAQGGGTRAVAGENFETLKALCTSFDYDKVSALDTVGLVMAHKLHLHVDFKFAPTDATLVALRKGLNVLVLGAERETRKLTAILEELNATSLDAIKLETHHAMQSRV